METKKIAVESDENGNLIIPSQLEFKKKVAFTVQVLSDEVLVLASEKEEFLSGFSFNDAVGLQDTLLILLEKKWTGAVECYTHLGNKKIFIRDGNLVFASADGIDERLGEVVYRSGAITLDDWTSSASQVTRGKKFGQVLLSAGLLDHQSLWKALADQVRQILTAVFLADKVFFRIHPNVAPRSQVMFTDQSKRIIKDCYYYSCLFRGFIERLQDETTIEPNSQKSAEFPLSGTYYGDLLSLLTSKTLVSDFVARCRLAKHYALLATMFLVDHKFLLIEGLSPLTFDFAGEAVLSKFNRLVQKYREFVSELKVLFWASKIDFPVLELMRMANRMVSGFYDDFFLDEEGYLDSSSIAHMSVLCMNDSEMVEHYKALIEALAYFLLQVCQNLLLEEQYSVVLENFRKFMSYEEFA